MDINKFLNKLKDENGIDKIEEQKESEYSGALLPTNIKIKSVLSGNNAQELKKWLTRLNGKDMDVNLSKELKTMINDNVPAVKFIERLFQIIQNQKMKVK